MRPVGEHLPQKVQDRPHVPSESVIVDEPAETGFLSTTRSSFTTSSIMGLVVFAVIEERGHSQVQRE